MDTDVGHIEQYVRDVQSSTYGHVRGGGPPSTYAPLFIRGVRVRGGHPRRTVLIEWQYVRGCARDIQADFRRAARRLHRKEPLSLIVVDYAGRVTPADPRAQRYIQVGQIANDLKTLAREFDVPILLLAQLNREAENGKKNHRPKLSHLRESGNLEQDADMVLFLHREEKFRADADLQGKAELIVAKNRDGPQGVFELAWSA